MGIGSVGIRSRSRVKKCEENSMSSARSFLLEGNGCSRGFGKYFFRSELCLNLANIDLNCPGCRLSWSQR